LLVTYRRQPPAPSAGGWRQHARSFNGTLRTRPDRQAVLLKRLLAVAARSARAAVPVPTLVTAQGEFKGTDDLHAAFHDVPPTGRACPTGSRTRCSPISRRIVIVARLPQKPVMYTQRRSVILNNTLLR
jgi:hypothetical protein